VVVEPCATCRGAGSSEGERALEVDIPAGIGDGSRLRIAGRGAAGEAGGRPGDLYVEVSIGSDDRFERHGADLIHRLRLGMAEAALGTTRTVPGIGGDEFQLEIPRGTQSGSVFKLSRRGMPRLRRRGRGDLLVEAIVEVPTELTVEQEEALRAYAEAAGEKPKVPSGRRRRRA
jgi:molecular chaperone DnaJ